MVYEVNCSKLINSNIFNNDKLKDLEDMFKKDLPPEELGDK